jgi:hypothetical protein
MGVEKTHLVHLWWIDLLRSFHDGKSNVNLYKKRRIKMKKLMLICLVCVLLTTAASQGITVSFDENGNGTYVDDSGGTFPLQWGTDDTPSVGLATLYYILPFPVVEGDVVLHDDAAFEVVSDVLRFVNVDTTALQPRVYVYSEMEADELPPYDLADNGIPDPFLTNLLRVVEQGTEDGWSGLNDYTPQFIAVAASEPGYMTDVAVTYNFTSDVPEPATIALFGLGALFLLKKRRA